ncbi:MAG: HNH endonuclease [Desulfobulbaceae bacterium]|nr:HNH endonuclease [Desulfobulbaceae bacterium]
MKGYVKNYLRAAGIKEGEFIPCEVCGLPAVDLHHIESRGMGGSKTKDNPENLIALCRLCHTKAHAYPEIQKPILQEIHDQTMEGWKK